MLDPSGPKICIRIFWSRWVSHYGTLGESGSQKKPHGLLMPPGRWDPEKISVLDVFCGGFALAELVARETK